MSLSLLPPNDGADRENAILDYIRSGQFEVTWSKVTSSIEGHSAEFWVFADALKIDSVRVNVSASTAQVIADLLGSMMLTAKLADLIWMQREFTLPPFPRPITSTTAAMVEHSGKIDAALEKLGYTGGLVSTSGKVWILDNAIADGRLLHGAEVACNYGWHFEGASFQGIAGEVVASQARDATGKPMRLIQGRGTRHNRSHCDYSQVCVLASRECTVDGQTMDLMEVLKSPELAPLASHQGVLKVLRQPGVAPVSPMMTPEAIDLGDIDQA